MHWESEFFLGDVQTCKWIVLAIWDQMANGLGSVVPELPGHGWEVMSTEGSCRQGGQCNCNVANGLL